MKKYDLIVIGAGPTGIACAIEAEKAGLDYLVLEKGLLVNSIFNFPKNMTFFSTSKKLEIGNIPFISHTEKPTRTEALEYYRRLVQAYDLNIQYYEGVEQVQKQSQDILIKTSKSTYVTSNVVIATGFYDTPNLLHVPGEDLPKVKHYYDDAHRYVGQDVLVVGAANSACDVALELWNKGANVTMAVRENELYQRTKYWILPNIENRIKEGSIKAYFSTVVKEIKEYEVILENADGMFVISNDFVMAMTGYIPDYKMLAKWGLSFDDSEDKIPHHNIDTLMTPQENIYIAGVINAGSHTSKLFIENTRDHGALIVKDILRQMNN